MSRKLKERCPTQLQPVRRHTDHGATLHPNANASLHPHHHVHQHRHSNPPTPLFSPLVTGNWADEGSTPLSPDARFYSDEVRNKVLENMKGEFTELESPISEPPEQAAQYADFVHEFDESEENQEPIENAPRSPLLDQIAAMTTAASFAAAAQYAAAAAAANAANKSPQMSPQANETQRPQTQPQPPTAKNPSQAASTKSSTNGNGTHGVENPAVLALARELMNPQYPTPPYATPLAQALAAHQHVHPMGNGRQALAHAIFPNHPFFNFPYPHDPVWRMGMPPATAPPPQPAAPYSNGGFAASSEQEEQLVQLTIEFLENTEVNPHQGSVPAESIHNSIKTQHPELYNIVVGSRHNSWRRFIERHSNIFHMFQQEAGKWRIRLLTHTNWADADRKQQMMRQANDDHILRCLVYFLQNRTPSECRVDEFIDAYPELPFNNPEVLVVLPKRGDLVRFVRKHPEHLYYDSEAKIISLKRGP